MAFIMTHCLCLKIKMIHFLFNSCITKSSQNITLESINKFKLPLIHILHNSTSSTTLSLLYCYPLLSMCLSILPLASSTVSRLQAMSQKSSWYSSTSLKRISINLLTPLKNIKMTSWKWSTLGKFKNKEKCKGKTTKLTVLKLMKSQKYQELHSSKMTNKHYSCKETLII